MEEEVFLDNHQEILDIIDFGFPRMIYDRPNYFKEMYDIRLTKQTILQVLESIDHLEYNNDM